MAKNKGISREEFESGLNPFGGSGSYNPDARVAATGGGPARKRRSGKHAKTINGVGLSILGTILIVILVLIIFNS